MSVPILVPLAAIYIVLPASISPIQKPRNNYGAMAAGCVLTWDTLIINPGSGLQGRNKCEDYSNELNTLFE